MALRSLRPAITFGLIAGGLLLFFIVIGVPEHIPDLTRPLMLLLAFTFGAVLVHQLPDRTDTVAVLVNALLASILATVPMVLFMGAINHFQAEDANVKEVFDAVTLQATSVLSGVPTDELFPNPLPEDITDETPLRTDPMGGIVSFGVLLVVANLAGVGAYLGVTHPRLGTRLHEWQETAFAIRVGVVWWLVIALPLLAFAFIVVSEWDVIDLGKSEQVVQLVVSFLMVGAGLFAMRAPAAGFGTRTNHATRLAINLALDAVFIALALPHVTEGAIWAGIAMASVAINIHWWAAQDPRNFERVVTLNILMGTVLVAPLYLDQYQNQVLGLVGIHILLGLGLNVVVGYAGLLDLGYAAFFAIGAYAFAFLTAPRFVGNVQMRASLSAGVVTVSVVAPIAVLVGVYVWRRYLRAPRALGGRSESNSPAAYPQWLSLGIVVMSILITLVVLRLMEGTALRESFQHFPPLLIGLLVAMIAAAGSGVLLGFPVLRLRGDYLAIVTLGFGEIIRLLLTNLRDFTGGPQGVLQIVSPEFLDVKFSDPQAMLYLILLGCMLLAFLSNQFKNSRTGRAWGALRDDEDIAQASGINLTNTKLLAFVVGATFAGIGGVLFAARQHNIFPADFTLFVSIDVLSLIIIGGMGSIPGAIVGALVLIGLPEVLRGFEVYRIMIFGALLVAMMLVRPEGLLPATARRLELHEDKPSSPSTVPLRAEGDS